MSLADFKQWVTALEEAAYVGKVGSKCHCPIAMFYKATSPSRFPSLSMYRTRKSWFDGTNVHNAPNEPWEQAVISRVDNMNCQLVTREDTLAIIDLVEQNDKS